MGSAKGQCNRQDTRHCTSGRIGTDGNSAMTSRRKRMTDYVSRQYLLNEYDRQHQGPPGGARKIIAEAPAADVVPVIRCRDCKNRDEEDGFCTGRGWPCQLVPDDGFCDKGKKK